MSAKKKTAKPKKKTPAKAKPKAKPKAKAAAKKAAPKKAAARKPAAKKPAKAPAARAKGRKLATKAPKVAAKAPKKAAAPKKAIPMPRGAAKAAAAKAAAAKAAPPKAPKKLPGAKPPKKKRPSRKRSTTPKIQPASREAKPGLGFKWVCFQCNAKFYDLGKPDPVCPRCSADQRNKPSDSGTPPTPAPKRPAAPPMARYLEEEDSTPEEGFVDEGEEEAAEIDISKIEGGGGFSGPDYDD